MTDVVTNYGTPVSKVVLRTPESQRKKVIGMAFPIGKSTVGGYFAKRSGIQLVKDNIRQLLQTERGERVFLPNYGANLRKFLFQPLDEITFEQIKSEVVTSITNYTKGVKILKIQVRPLGENSIHVNLLLRIQEIETANVEVTI